MWTKLQAGTSNRTVLLYTHSSCFDDATARYVQGQNNFKGHFAATVAQSYSPWLVSVGINERRSLQRQSSHSLWTEGSHRTLHEKHPFDWIVACLCKQGKMRVYKHARTIFSICCTSNLSQHEEFICINVHRLSEHTHCLLQVHRNFRLTLLLPKWKHFSNRNYELDRKINISNSLFKFAMIYKKE